MTFVSGVGLTGRRHFPTSSAWPPGRNRILLTEALVIASRSEFCSAAATSFHWSEPIPTTKPAEARRRAARTNCGPSTPRKAVLPKGPVWKRAAPGRPRFPGTPAQLSSSTATCSWAAALCLLAEGFLASGSICARRRVAPAHHPSSNRGGGRHGEELLVQARARDREQRLVAVQLWEREPSSGIQILLKSLVATTSSLRSPALSISVKRRWHGILEFPGVRTASYSPHIKLVRKRSSPTGPLDQRLRRGGATRSLR